MPAKSDVASSYFRHLRKYARIKDGKGKLVLPIDLSFFRGSDRKNQKDRKAEVEHITRVSSPLRLEWTDHV